MKRVCLFLLLCQCACFAQVLSPKEKNIILISSLTASGDLQRLKPALHKALEEGLTLSEAKEIMIHLYAYCGFPRAIRGLQTLMEVTDQRGKEGMKITYGREVSQIFSSDTKYNRGKENLAKLTGIPPSSVLSGYAAFAPTIDVFLKEHLFSDLFDRDVLTYKEREWVTVSVIAAIGKAEPMLRSHLGICMRLGVSAGEMKEYVSTLSKTIGKKKLKSVNQILKEILKE